MKKKILVLVVVLLLLASTIQVAFADPPPDDPDNFGSCNMTNSWWAPLPYNSGPPPDNPDGFPTMTAIDYYMVDEDGNIIGEEVVDPVTGEPIGPVQQRGMAMAHYNQANPQWPTNGAYNMDAITTAHCG
jgi:hypothetical protein